MVVSISCTNCGKEGCSPELGDRWIFPKLVITDRKKSCDVCNHIEEREVVYYFCSIVCMREWLNKYQDRLPCQCCDGTGDTNARHRDQFPELQVSICGHCDGGWIKA